MTAHAHAGVPEYARGCLRLVAGTAVAFALGACLTAGVAQAFSSFGTRFYGSSSTGAGFQEYGSAVSIEVPRPENHTVVAHEIELERVANQGDFGSAPSLIQTGLYRSGDAEQLDTCTQSVDEYTYFMEYKVEGSNSYNCATYGVAPTLQIDYFETFAWPAVGSGEWGFGMANGNGGGYFSGENIASTTAIPMVGEELNNNAGTQCQASSSTVAGFYAYPYDPYSDNWFVAFAPNASTFNPIVNPNNTNLLLATNTNLWSIPNVPFNETSISHTGSTTCDTNHGNG